MYTQKTEMNVLSVYTYDKVWQNNTTEIGKA